MSRDSTEMNEQREPAPEEPIVAAEATTPAGEDTAPQDGSMPNPAEIQELRDRLQRTAAEFQNFRKQTEKRQGDLRKFVMKDFFEQILPIVDNFDAAMGASDGGQDPASVLVGVKMIHQMLHKLLADNHLARIPALGEVFDPAIHEAIAREETDGADINRVVQEIRKGYRMGDLVVRHAHVCVAVPPAPPAPESDSDRDPQDTQES